MVRPFIASAPADQHRETYRQFVELQRKTGDTDARLLRLFEFVIANFSFAAHGTMFNTSPITGPNIPDPGWTKLTTFTDEGAVRGITFDLPNDEWTYTLSGVYQVSLELILSHNESNQGRQFRVRLNDGVTAPPDGVPVSVGRNQPGSNVSVSFLQEINPGDPNRTFFVEVGGGPDAIGSCVWEATSVTIVNVGAWLDEVPT